MIHMDDKKLTPGRQLKKQKENQSYKNPSLAEIMKKALGVNSNPQLPTTKTVDVS